MGICQFKFFPCLTDSYKQNYTFGFWNIYYFSDSLVLFRRKIAVQRTGCNFIVMQCIQKIHRIDTAIDITTFRCTDIPRIHIGGNNDQSIRQMAKSPISLLDLEKSCN